MRIRQLYHPFSNSTSTKDDVIYCFVLLTQELFCTFPLPNFEKNLIRRDIKNINLSSITGKVNYKRGKMRGQAAFQSWRQVPKERGGNSFAIAVCPSVQIIITNINMVNVADLIILHLEPHKHV